MQGPYYESNISLSANWGMVICSSKRNEMESRPDTQTPLGLPHSLVSILNVSMHISSVTLDPEPVLGNIFFSRGHRRMNLHRHFHSSLFCHLLEPMTSVWSALIHSFCHDLAFQSQPKRPKAAKEWVALEALGKWVPISALRNEVGFGADIDNKMSLPLHSMMRYGSLGQTHGYVPKIPGQKIVKIKVQ